MSGIVLILCGLIISTDIHKWPPNSRERVTVAAVSALCLIWGAAALVFHLNPNIP